MIYGFYFRLLKIFKNKWICSFFSKLLYLGYICKFQLYRLKLKKRKINITVDEAKQYIENVYPDPAGEPVVYNQEIDSKIDLSIIIPVYNYVDLIETTLESIIHQRTNYSYEVIIVDDGSTDGARDILKKYSNKENVKVIFQDNQGIAGARNTGINQSVGKYLMLVDCDDFVHDNIVEILMNKAYEKDYDMVMCAHNLSKEKDGKIYSIIPNIYPDFNLIGYKNGDKIMNLPGLPWCKVYKRNLWNNIRFFPGYWYEDTIIQMLIFTQCKSYSYIPVVCYEYRWYEKNFSHTQVKSKSKKCIDRYWLLLAILRKHDELNLKKDDIFYTVLLKHISSYFLNTMGNLTSDEIDALFILIMDLLLKYKPNHKVRLPYMLKVTEKAILEGNVELWKLASKYQ